MNLGVPGARIALIKEQVRVAQQVGTKAHRVRSEPERIAAFNRAIVEDAKWVNAGVVDLFASPVRDDLISDLGASI